MRSQNAGGAEEAPDLSYRLTYADPVGETVVRRLTGATVQVSWENGAHIHFQIDDLKPLLDLFDYRVSRKGRMWAAKKKSPVAPGDQNQKTSR